jgi:hypothetical protein
MYSDPTMEKLRKELDSRLTEDEENLILRIWQKSDKLSPYTIGEFLEKECKKHGIKKEDFVLVQKVWGIAYHGSLGATKWKSN